LILRARPEELEAFAPCSVNKAYTISWQTINGQPTEVRNFTSDGTY
jgi:hypothetical protein